MTVSLTVHPVHHTHTHTHTHTHSWWVHASGKVPPITEDQSLLTDKVWLNMSTGQPVNCFPTSPSFRDQSVCGPTDTFIPLSVLSSLSFFSSPPFSIPSFSLGLKAAFQPHSKERDFPSSPENLFITGFSHRSGANPDTMGKRLEREIWRRGEKVRA